ncbi:glutamate racemase [Kordiimonas sediminis]|uniref:Glutamate racemase n=1 Tax=Kordiimonas sediminis TaxID=1735581 RepID=A0A919AWM5_9PROT|nr:aspartate/glutamate racemase family protein [Kordiimonas sediminis]GHF30013.1 glutamate racemase [Kordiimonas sediminis]
MIGVFDSGSGGITILQALRSSMPDQDFLYLGDHANAPYGHRSNQQIVDLTIKGVDRLMAAGCTLVILACNTAAAVALRHIQQTWLPHTYPNNRVLGVLVPMVEAVTGVPWHHIPHAAEDTAKQTGKSILLFATRKTIESRAYHDEVEKRAPGISLLDKPCPGLVDAIEGGAGASPIAGLIAGYVAEALTMCERPDAVILGCTHFPLAAQHFITNLPENTPVFSQPDIVAQSLKDYLERHKGLVIKGDGDMTLLTTGDPASVNRLSAFLPDGFRNFKGAI